MSKGKTKATQKQTYRIRNWPEYNRALIARGSLTVWFDDAVASQWYEKEKTGRRGASNHYSEIAIQSALRLQTVYGLALRGAQGLLASLLSLLGLSALGVPDYSTLSRRRQRLQPTLTRTRSATPRHVVIDSTGLKVFGEGEWKVRQHGVGKRRTWRKLHLGVDEATGEVVASLVTVNGVGDSEVLPELLDQVDEPIAQVSGDGAYDTHQCYRVIAQRQALASIPPAKNAQPWPDDENGLMHPRTTALRRIGEIGRAAWKREIGYHRRSLAETAMFRLKTLFGGKLKARSFTGQTTESYLQVDVLNRMTRLGMPVSVERA